MIALSHTCGVRGQYEHVCASHMRMPMHVCGANTHRKLMKLVGCGVCGPAAIFAHVRAICVFGFELQTLEITNMKNTHPTRSAVIVRRCAPRPSQIYHLECHVRGARMHANKSSRTCVSVRVWCNSSNSIKTLGGPNIVIIILDPHAAWSERKQRPDNATLAILRAVSTVHRAISVCVVAARRLSWAFRM